MRLIIIIRNKRYYSRTYNDKNRIITVFNNVIRNGIRFLLLGGSCICVKRPDRKCETLVVMQYQLILQTSTNKSLIEVRIIKPLPAKTHDGDYY